MSFPFIGRLERGDLSQQSSQPQERQATSLAHRAIYVSSEKVKRLSKTMLWVREVGNVAKLKFCEDLGVIGLDNSIMRNSSSQADLIENTYTRGKQRCRMGTRAKFLVGRSGTGNTQDECQISSSQIQ